MNNSINYPKQFEEGSIYTMSFITDSELKPQFICVKRTKSMVTFERFQDTEVVKRRVKVGSDGFEYIVDGNYSMAPSINAKNMVG